MGLFSFYYVFFIVKCHYGNNLYGSKNQEKTDQIHTGELVPRKIHVSRALDTGSTVTKRLAFTLPRMLMPRPYIVNGMREPTMATASEAAIILPSM